jgi:hypothetical protein
MNVYTYVDIDGQSHEAVAGSIVTTQIQRIDDAAESAYNLGAAIGSFVPLEVQHSYADLDGYDDALLARWGITRTVIADPVLDPNPVPTRVSALQLTLALDELGLLDGVESAVAASPRSVQLYWAKTDPFERSHPMIDQLAAAIGKTSADADNVFRLAITKA